MATTITAMNFILTKIFFWRWFLGRNQSRTDQVEVKIVNEARDTN